MNKTISANQTTANVNSGCKISFPKTFCNLNFHELKHPKRSICISLHKYIWTPQNDLATQETIKYWVECPDGIWKVISIYFNCARVHRISRRFLAHFLLQNVDILTSRIERRLKLIIRKSDGSIIFYEECSYCNVTFWTLQWVVHLLRLLLPLAQWWEHSPPTNVARVRFPDSASYVGWVCCWFSSLAPRGFSPGTPVFPSPQKPTLLNSNSIWKVSPISAPR